MAKIGKYQEWLTEEGLTKLVCRGRRKTAGGFLWEDVGDCNG